MGERAQKRLIRKLDLERFLAKVKSHPSPNVKLEQYTTSESVAATMLYLAAYSYKDIEGKNVLDLGCGTGRLSLTAAFLGAQSVVGIDIDKIAINVAVENARATGLMNTVDWIIGDVDAIAGEFDTVIQNPPFGVQKHAADRRFLEKALQVGKRVYSLHNHPYFDKQLASVLKAGNGRLVQVEASPFLQRFIKTRGGIIEAVYALPLVIPHMFNFHTRARQEVIIDLYVIKKNE